MTTETDNVLTVNGQRYVNPIVCGNAWLFDEDGNETYCDPDEERPDGWSVYVRWHDERGDFYPFEITDDHDFDTEDEADLFAETLARRYGLDPDETRFY